MRITTVDAIHLKTDFKFRTVDIVAGYPFQFLSEKRKFFLSTTPYSDPTLVPIDDVAVGSDDLQFIATIKSKKYRYSVKYGSFPEAPLVSRLIAKTNDGYGFNSALGSSTDIEYQAERDRIAIRLSDGKTKVIRFVLPNRRIIFYQPASDTIINCLQGTAHLVGDTLCFLGKNTDDQSEFELAWKLEFPSEIADPIHEIVDIFVKENASTRWK